MIFLHVETVVGAMVPDLTDGLLQVFVPIPEAVCADFNAALKLWPVGKYARFEFHPTIVVEGLVRAIHEQMALSV